MVWRHGTASPPAVVPCSHPRDVASHRISARRASIDCPVDYPIDCPLIALSARDEPQGRQDERRGQDGRLQ
eukprot:1749129-Prymnesium_polylepis.1